MTNNGPYPNNRYRINIGNTNGINYDSYMIDVLFIIPVVPPPLLLFNPTISSLTPSHGISGNIVTIKGTNLDTVTAVFFGIIEALSFNIVNHTELIAVVPTLPIGPHNISVKKSAYTSPYSDY